MRHAVSISGLDRHCRNPHRVFAILPTVNAWPDNKVFQTAWKDNPEDALANLEGLARRLGRTNDPESAVTVAKHHTRLGRPDQARRWLYPLLDHGNDGYVALHLANSFRFDEGTADFDEALGHAQRALTLARRNRDGALAQAALLALGELLEITLKPKQALEVTGEAMGISEALGIDAASIEPLAALSRLHFKNGNRSKPNTDRRCVDGRGVRPP
jgi:tetratricopeptide (TPR) repeat protein